MNLLIQNGRVIDPATARDEVADLAIAAGRVLAIGAAPEGFAPDRVIDARGCVVAPGLVDLYMRLGEPGHEHSRMLESEMAAALSGGVTSLVCPPDTDPVLDEPGLVEMLRFRAERLRGARVFPLGALTRTLAGQVLTEMVELTESGCVGFSQAQVPLVDTQVLLRAMQYAGTFDYGVWLRPQDAHLGRGVAASGPLATRLGLSGIPVLAESIAVFTLVELVRATRTRVHLCRLSSAAGLELVRRARDEGLPITCDVSIHSLNLIDTDMGYFDSRARFDPPLRQQRDREALRAGLADGSIDALVSDHLAAHADDKTLPFAEAAVGATAVELLLSQALKWGQSPGVGLMRALAVVTNEPGRLLAAQAKGDRAGGLGRLCVGQAADLCIFDPSATWRVEPGALVSQGRHTPFEGHELPGRVQWTLVGGQVVFERARAP